LRRRSARQQQTLGVPAGIELIHVNTIQSQSADRAGNRQAPWRPIEINDNQPAEIDMAALKLDLEELISSESLRRMHAEFLQCRTPSDPLTVVRETAADIAQVHGVLDGLRSELGLN
jgi:hypothetical protein